jgi:hypothetical protein
MEFVLYKFSSDKSQLRQATILFDLTQIQSLQEAWVSLPGNRNVVPSTQVWSFLTLMLHFRLELYTSRRLQSHLHVPISGPLTLRLLWAQIVGKTRCLDLHLKTFLPTAMILR